MSSLVRTSTAFAGAMPLPSLSAAGRAVAALNPDFWWSASEVPTDARGVTIVDRVRGLKATGAFYGEVGSPARPAIRLNGSVYQTVPYQIPQSYGIFVLGRVNAYVASTGAMCIASRSNAGNRIYFSVNPSGALELAHTSQSIVSDTLTGTSAAFCGWGAYDHGENTCAVACNTATPETTGTFTNDHKGQSESAIGGWEISGVGSAMFNGWLEEIIVFAAPMNNRAYQYHRETVMAFLAEQGGVTLT